MKYDVTQMPSSMAYQLLTQVVVPRPVAWVLTQHENKNLNLAPFSYFSPVASNPPLIMISIGKKRDGSHKDTYRNIVNNERFVVHVGQSIHAKAMSLTARELPVGESEVELARLATCEFEGFDLPRLAEAPVALACELYRVDEIGDGPMHVVYGKVVSAWLDDGLNTDPGNDKHFANPEKLNAIARLGGDNFTSVTDIIEIPRG